MHENSRGPSFIVVRFTKYLESNVALYYSESRLRLTSIFDTASREVRSVIKFPRLGISQLHAALWSFERDIVQLFYI